MKYFYICLILHLCWFPCKAQDNVVSEQIAKQYLENLIASQSSGALVLVEFKKTNGVSKTIQGAQGYEVDYDMIIQATQPVWKDWMENMIWKDYKVSVVAPSKSSMPMTQITNAMRFRGQAQFQMTENGWRGISFSNSEKADLNYDAIEKKKVQEQKAAIVEQNKQVISSLVNDPGVQNSSNCFDYSPDPIGGHGAIQLKFKNNDTANEIEFGLFRSAVTKRFVVSRRLRAIPENSFVNLPDNYDFGIVEIEFDNVLYQTIPQQDGSMSYSMEVRYHYGIIDSTGKMVFKEDITQKAGSGILEVLSKEEAQMNVYDKIQNWAGTFMHYFFTFQVEIISIDETKGNKIKEITVNNGQLMDPQTDLDIKFYKKSDVELRGSSIFVKSAPIAKGEVKRIHENGTAKVKIWESQEVLKTYIDEGIALYIITYPKALRK
jgi:hypothetical protein